jgi:UDP-glucuronate 4-epimerase
MTVMVTGSAGFIGYHTAERLLAAGEKVVGVDNLNDYYDVRLKFARLERLQRHPNFTFIRMDIADKKGMENSVAQHSGITHIIHLAAQAGVRYSLEKPQAYAHSNLSGFLVILELCRHLPNFKHLVFASSSSVYGNNAVLPFSVNDPVDKPMSFYAATKIANEAMAYSYSHLYNISMTGLRFFTVYGPWGRPDMAIYLFAKAIHEGIPLKLFNNGKMQRDFTYIDDVVEGIVTCLGRPQQSTPPYKIYNLGNHKSEPVSRFLELIEHAMGRKVPVIVEPIQAGDMRETYADISESTRDFGFYPKTSIDEGIPKFIEWFKDYHQAPDKDEINKFIRSL